MRKSPTAARQAKAAPPPPTPNLVKPIEQRFGPIEHWPLERLLPFAQNPRKHPERQIVQLAASIAEFGFVVPALVDEAGSVITGHARLEAARRLGMTELPVIVARCWSKAQVQAYRLADNRLAELGSWDDQQHHRKDFPCPSFLSVVTRSRPPARCPSSIPVRASVRWQRSSPRRR